MQEKFSSVLLAMVFLLSGCGCKKSYMAENYIVEPEDKTLNCQQLIYAINEAEFWIKNVDARCSRPHIFAKFVPCTPMVKMDAARNEYILNDRVSYLRSLYKLKGCEARLKLNSSPISNQARVIGWDKYKNEKHQQRVIQNLEFNRDNLKELPTNIPLA